MASDIRVEAGPVGPVVRPPDPTGVVVLYLHRGGDTGASPQGGYEPAERLALGSGATVVLPRYRATFPEALADVQRSYRFCRDEGPVVVAGERLGAGLAASLMVWLRDNDEPLPQCAIMVAALLDLTLEAKSVLLNATADPAFDLKGLRRHVARYAAGADPADALLSPVCANLDGLPPVQLLVAGTDPLLDDSLAFAARAARSRVTVDLRVWQNAASLRAGTLAAMTGFIPDNCPVASV